MIGISGMQITLQTPEAEPQRKEGSDNDKNNVKRFQRHIFLSGPEARGP